MYNPLEKGEIGSTIFTVATGWKAHRNGAEPLEAINVGLWWRWWYKNLTLSFFILFWAVGLTVVNLMSGKYLWLVWIGPVQVLVDIFVFSICYVSLIDISRGFKQRLWYRLWAPLQHRCFPNVMRLWWYLLALFPFWVLLWMWIFFTPMYCAGPAVCS